MKTQTQVQIAQDNRLSVGEELREITKISDFYRKLMIYQAGMCFLHDQYPNSSEELTQSRAKFERSANFWKWFRSEWHLWEQDLLCYITENKVDLTEDMYWTEMIALIHCGQTTHGFSQFIKIFKNSL